MGFNHFHAKLALDFPHSLAASKSVYSLITHSSEHSSEVSKLVRVNEAEPGKASRSWDNAMPQRAR
jgi:hypothetical protein